MIPFAAGPSLLLVLAEVGSAGATLSRECAHRLPAQLSAQRAPRAFLSTPPPLPFLQAKEGRVGAGAARLHVTPSSSTESPALPQPSHLPGPKGKREPQAFHHPRVTLTPGCPSGTTQRPAAELRGCRALRATLEAENQEARSIPQHTHPSENA